MVKHFPIKDNEPSKSINQNSSKLIKVKISMPYFTVFLRDEMVYNTHKEKKR